MKKPVCFTMAVTAACFLLAGTALPQSSEKPDTPLQKRKPSLKVSAIRQSTSTTSYIVRAGDTLYSLANTHGTTVDVVKSMNHLDTNLLLVGQRLKFSAPDTPTVETADAVPSEEATETEGPPEGKTPAVGVVRAENPADQVFITAGKSSGSDDGIVAGESTEPPLRYRLASAGLNFLGVRYRWNGNSPSSGFDCSGLVKSLFEKFNISLPRTSREQYMVGERIDKDKLEVGDLVFFSSRGRTPSHVGVYLGDNMFLHAARKARKVLISNLTAAWYSKRFLGARRLSDLWESEPQPKPAEAKSN
ncbi:MAG TPA: NlpC/P60 family protein [Acidobacteriota bacterium]|nr:NlpC/P60 family protein [Acidobacteriota bacterium]